MYLTCHEPSLYTAFYSGTKLLTDAQIIKYENI